MGWMIMEGNKNLLFCAKKETHDLCVAIQQPEWKYHVEHNFNQNIPGYNIQKYLSKKEKPANED